MLKGLYAVSADGEYRGTADTNRRLSFWQKLPIWAQALAILAAVASSSFAGGAISTNALGDIQALRALPARVSVHDSLINELGDAINENHDRADIQWLYLACRLESGDGACEWILPQDLAARLRDIRLFIRTAPPGFSNTLPDSLIGGLQ